MIPENDIIVTDTSTSGMNYMTLFDLKYSFRLQTGSIFEEGHP